MSSAVQTWVCRGCGQQNEPSWRCCAVCEALPDGSPRAQLAPKQRKNRGESLLPGLVTLAVLLVLVAAMVIFRPQVQEAVTAYFG
jgi:hypothetical protein